MGAEARARSRRARCAAHVPQSPSEAARTRVCRCSRGRPPAGSSSVSREVARAQRASRQCYCAGGLRFKGPRPMSSGASLFPCQQMTALYSLPPFGCRLSDLRLNTARALSTPATCALTLRSSPSREWLDAKHCWTTVPLASVACHRRCTRLIAKQPKPVRTPGSPKPPHALSLHGTPPPPPSPPPHTHLTPPFVGYSPNSNAV